MKKIRLLSCTLSALSVLAAERPFCTFTGAEGRKAGRFLAERVFGAEARGRIYEEAANAFRTHYDDCHPEEGWMKKDKGLWQGEYWGKTMHSAAVVAEWTADAELKAWIRDRARAFVKEFQQPDGYLCSYLNREFVGGRKPDADKRVGWDTEIFCWNIWGRKYTMWALIECARVTEAPDLLEAACRLMDQEIDQLAKSGTKIEDTGFFVGLPSMSVLKPLLVLYRTTGNKSYLDFAKGIVAAMDRAGNPAPNLVANAFGDKPFHEWYATPEWWAKAYETMSCLEGLIDYAQMQKEPRILEAVKRIVAKLEKHELNALGCVGFFDHFTHAGACVNATTEPCDVTHWIRVNRDLFLATDDPHYLDTVEFAYYNAFLAGVYRDGKWGAHSVRSHGARHRSAPHQVGMQYHQCCIDNMPRTFVDIAQTTVTHAKSGALSVNFYSDAALDSDLGKLSITGGYPVGDRVKVAFGPGKGGRARFRIPSCFDSVRVDGRPASGSWFMVDVPKEGRTFELRFVRSPRMSPSPRTAGCSPREKSVFETAYENPEMKDLARKTPGVRVQYGPILLAKGLYAGTSKDDVLKDLLTDVKGWKLSVAPAKPVKTDGAWTLTLSKDGVSHVLPVGDFASIADADDASNLFSIWF